MKDIILGSYIGFMLGYVTSRLVMLPLENVVSNKLEPFFRYVASYFRRVPYISADVYTEAIEHLGESFEQAITDKTPNGTLKICPWCKRFKRNFASDGRNRKCMDCEFSE